jgi:uncharacterized membrane protein YhaH (DUF805 family)
MEHFLSAQGRIGRRTFFFRRIGILVACCVTVAAALVVLKSVSSEDANINQAIIALLAIPFSIADILQAVKRCHDIDRSGWYILLTCIPLLGIAAAIPLFFKKGTSGPNRFGDDPVAFVSLMNHYAS